MIALRSHSFVLAVAASAMILAGNAFAAPLPTTPNNNLLYDVKPGAAGSGFGNKGSWGLTFTISSPITVSALGLWDDNSNGLVVAHEVGLWEYAAAMQASAVIDNLSTVVPSFNTSGRWLFTTLATPVTLHVGTYTLGFYNPAGGDNFYNFAGSNQIYQSGAAFANASGKANVGSLVWPNTNSGASGWVGPNLQTTAVPEVGSIVMGSIGAVGLLLATRYRTKTIATK